MLSESDAGQKLYADGACVGYEESISVCHMENEVHEKACHNKPLTEAQKKLNREKSRARARVEHLFGCMTNSMDAIGSKTISLVRAAAKIGLSNLTYNSIALCAA